MGCNSCQEAADKPWDKDRLVELAKKNNIGGLKDHEIEERLDTCDLCPFREGHACTKKSGVAIFNWMIFRQPCPEGFWSDLEPLPLEHHKGYEVDDNGTVYGPDGVTPAPCGNCRFRRSNVKWTKPPEITPYCTLYNRVVSWKECCECTDREEG